MLSHFNEYLWREERNSWKINYSGPGWDSNTTSWISGQGLYLLSHLATVIKLVWSYNPIICISLDWGRKLGIFPNLHDFIDVCLKLCLPARNKKYNETSEIWLAVGFNFPCVVVASWHILPFNPIIFLKTSECRAQQKSCENSHEIKS